MPNKTIEDFAYQVRDYMRTAEVVPGKNIAYSQENNAVIASIENGKSYKVRWTGSATITLKKDSASGTEITSGSTSPLSFTADADYDLYFGSSADVTEIMVYDGASTSDAYEPYYVPVKDRFEDIKIAEATKNQNWEDQLSILNTAYSKMTSRQRDNSYIILINNGVRVGHIPITEQSIGAYSHTILLYSGNILTRTIRLSNQKVVETTITPNGSVQYSDISATNNIFDVELYCKY